MISRRLRTVVHHNLNIVQNTLLVEIRNPAEISASKSEIMKTIVFGNGIDSRTNSHRPGSSTDRLKKIKCDRDDRRGTSHDIFSAEKKILRISASVKDPKIMILRLSEILLRIRIRHLKREIRTIIILPGAPENRTRPAGIMLAEIIGKNRRRLWNLIHIEHLGRLINFEIVD